MTSLSLSNRLRIGFALLIGLLAIVSVLGVGRLFQIRQDFEDESSRYFQLETQVERMRSAFILQQAALPAPGRQPRRAAFVQARQASRDAIAAARQLAAGDRDAEELLEGRVVAERRWRELVAAPLMAGGSPPAERQRALAVNVAEAGATLSNSVQGDRLAARQRAVDDTRLAAILIVAGLIAALLVAIVLFSGLVNSMRGPLERLLAGARRLAGGQLGTRVEVGGPIEIATLGRAFNEMAEELEREARERDRVEQMKDDFLLTVSHELRTPVTAVKGLAEMLVGGPDSLRREQRESLEAIHDSAGDLTTLVDDLLDLARSDAGRLRLNRQPTAVRPLLDRVAGRLRPQLESKRQSLRISVARGTPRLHVDPDRIGQVLTNLLANANKYSPEGAKVRIAARRAGRTIEIEVSDNGPGMGEEELEFVFERFWRAEASEQQEVGGTGLGLAIAKSLVELHGGSIEADSAPGEGTSFRLRLPATRRAAIPHSNANGRRTRRSARSAARAGRRRRSARSAGGRRR